jgi:mono/diheme cytochrome c family protein
MRIRTAIIGLLAVLLVALWWALWPRDRESGEAPSPLSAAQADLVTRGRDLVVLANCDGCHTSRAGVKFAGGRAIPTPFGTFYSPNITQDAETGIGRWNAQDFWHALHNGYAPGRRLLYPTFPYTNYTRISRADADAMFAYLKTVPAAHAVSRGHQLKFPFSQRWLLTVWRGLFFRPGVYEVDASHDAAWNRGAYLVQGVAHCSACHEARNALGAVRSKDNPSGGLVLSWYAPSLTSSREAGVQTWSEDEIVGLLRSGQIRGAAPGSTIPGHQASTFGPMAEVVYESLQHTQAAELRAMATYLKSLPDTGKTAYYGPVRIPASQVPIMMSQGQQIYADNCARCHGDQGEGRAPAAPPLAGSRIVTMGSSIDLVRMVLYGGYAPGTELNPRPFGMPPFYPTLHSEEIANVLTFVRDSWGNEAQAVSADEVEVNMTGPLW